MKLLYTPVDYSDDFSDVDSTFEILYRPSFWFVARELAKLLICTAAILCDSLIIYAVVKLNRWGESIYFYLLGWAIFNLLSCFVSPFVLFAVKGQIDNETIYFEDVCLLLQIHSGCLFLTYLSVLLLVLDWTLGTYFRSRYQFYKDRIVFVKILFFVFAVLYMTYSMVYCLSNWRTIRHTSLLYGLNFLTVFIAVLGIFHYFYSRRRNLLLCQDFDFTIVLPAVFVLCWLPYLLVHMFMNHIKQNENLLIFLYFFGECLAYGNAVANVYLLAKTDDQFRAKFYEFIRCKCRDDEFRASNNGRSVVVINDDDKT